MSDYIAYYCASLSQRKRYPRWMLPLSGVCRATCSSNPRRPSDWLTRAHLLFPDFQRKICMLSKPICVLGNFALALQNFEREPTVDESQIVDQPVGIAWKQYLQARRQLSLIDMIEVPQNVARAIVRQRVIEFRVNAELVGSVQHRDEHVADFLWRCLDRIEVHSFRSVLCA